MRNQVLRVLCGFIVGALLSYAATKSLWCDRERRLLDQAAEISEILLDCEKTAFKPAQIKKRIQDLGYRVERSSYGERSLLVLFPEVGALGLGSRWIVHMRTDSKGFVSRSNLEMQPVGWP
jgi:hypothetical protein